MALSLQPQLDGLLLGHAPSQRLRSSGLSRPKRRKPTKQHTNAGEAEDAHQSRLTAARMARVA